MKDKETSSASEPSAPLLSESVRKSGLLGKVMELSRPDKRALMTYLEQDIDNEESFKMDSLGRIVLTEEMKDSVAMAENALEKGECITEEVFKQRFAKWL